ncbi:hypothetical protein STEG23_014965 [Scotinomys teguina]
MMISEPFLLTETQYQTRGDTRKTSELCDNKCLVSKPLNGRHFVMEALAIGYCLFLSPLSQHLEESVTLIPVRREKTVRMSFLLQPDNHRFGRGSEIGKEDNSVLVSVFLRRDIAKELELDSL